MKKDILFKIENGTQYKEDKRDITITEQECRYRNYKTKNNKNVHRRENWYKYTCGICGWTEGWMLKVVH